MDLNPNDTRIALDLSRYAWRQQHGDITAYGTWFGTETRRPVLVLVPSYRSGAEKVTPCIVPLESAWAWDESIGDPRHCARTSAEFVAHLGLGRGMYQAFRVARIIRDHLGDLLSMPPEPVELIEVGDAIRTDEHGRQHHSVIRERDNA